MRAVLAKQPQDQDAYKAKVTAHLQLAEWPQALQLINKAPAAGAAAFQFEKVSR